MKLSIMALVSFMAVVVVLTVDDTGNGWCNQKSLNFGQMSPLHLNQECESHGFQVPKPHNSRMAVAARCAVVLLPRVLKRVSPIDCH